MRKFLPLLLLAVALAVGMTWIDPQVNANSSNIVISQVYGGGGGAGAIYANDFIELFNRGTSPVSLAGWSVQYASSTGTSWQRTDLSNVALAPGQYYLVQEFTGAAGFNIPTPDATGIINLSSTAGKVALVSNQTTIAFGSTGCPFSASIVDFVGYGAGTNCFEGLAPTATLSNSASAIRTGNSCTDTDSNSLDFVAGTVNPRNTSFLGSVCVNPTNPIGVGAANPTSVPPGGTTLLQVTVTPGVNPTSSGLSVTADLGAIGGSAFQQVFDDGTHGDAVAGDQILSFQASVAQATSAGAKLLPVTIADAQGRNGSTSVSLTVTAVSTPPTGVTAANPASLHAADTTLLTVTVTPGVLPTSTGISVVGDLTLIGGAAAQTFYDDGTHGDVMAGDNVFSFRITVSAATSVSPKSMPIVIADAQARSSVATMALTVKAPGEVTTVKISQVYGGGGNSGATYTNDFIEIYNQAATPVDLTGWSVQYSAAGGVWTRTNICPLGGCVLAPGAYFLVQESAGLGGTVPLPQPDAIGIFAMGSTQGKVALVTDSTTLIGVCPFSPSVVDTVSYGGAVCGEGFPVGLLSNTTAAVRKGNGCVDTDSNLQDFVTIAPIPRNTAAPTYSCGGDPTKPSGLGTASPSSIGPASVVRLTVAVTPATVPPSTGLAVSADLTSIGGSPSQMLFDDGSHGDQVAGDGLFSLQTTIDVTTQPGIKNIVAMLSDAQGRSDAVPITLTVESPTCGVERWSVKVGSDPDAGQVNLGTVWPDSVVDLASIFAPSIDDLQTTFANARVAPVEIKKYVVDATLTFYKRETDLDYHFVLDDGAGHTLIAAIPSPACILSSTLPRVLVSSPFGPGIANARAKFDAALTAGTSVQIANIPVRVTGIGFFDPAQGETGAAPNGIQLHPVLDISFRSNTTATVASSLNPSPLGQAVTFTATVSGDHIPSGAVTFFAGPDSLTTLLDQNGQATFTTGALPVGSHAVTVSYLGSDTSVGSTSPPLQQVVESAALVPTATLNATTFAAGATITATIANGPGTAGDWVGLFKTSDSDSIYQDWKYFGSGTKTKPPTGVTGGSVTFVAPATAGTYNVRFFLNDSTQKLATSATLTVTVTAPPTLSLDKTIVAPGDTICVTVIGSQSAGDWVGLFKTSDSDSIYQDWKYVGSGTNTRPPNPVSPATVCFFVPATPGSYEIRLFKNDSLLKLATSATITPVVTAPPTILLNPATINAGQTVTASITNGPGTTGDWVGLFVSNASDSDVVDWKYLSGTKTKPLAGQPSADLTFTVSAPGSYTIRFFLNDSLVKLATSAQLTVNATTTITPNFTTVGPGGAVTATITNGPGLAGDWVGLFATASSDSIYVDWMYLNGTKTKPGAGVTGASLVFTLPTTPGTYNLRFFRDDSLTKLTTSPTITVTASAPVVTVSATTVAPGGSVTATVANGPAAAGDWVGLFKVSDPDANYVDWQYLGSGTKTKPGNGVSGANVNFTLPNVPGAYNVRFFFNDSTLLLAQSATITVTGTLPTVSVDTTTVAPGGTVTATIANGPGNAADWVGVFATADSDSIYQDWKYLNGTKAKPATGVTGASVPFTMPLTPGTYNVRFFLNDSLVKLAASATITVQ